MTGRLGELQAAHDIELLRGRPWLLRRKWSRMAKSSFAFLRGSAPLWAELLRRHPAFLRGIPGKGPIIGDLHLENFGTMRTARGMVFQINDFDETFVGPWAFDVLRLMTSIVLARSELGVPGTFVLTLAEAVLDGHELAMGKGRLAAPEAIHRVIAAGELAGNKTLHKRFGEEGRLVRDPEKTPEAPAALRKQLPATLREWQAGLPEKHRPADAALEILDCTRRVAGTGSLGVERLQVLIRGEKHPWLLTVKEVRGSPADPKPASAERLVELMRRCLREAPLLLGASRLGPLPVIVSRTGPGEDKLAVDAYERTQLLPICRYLGYLTGDVHAQGASSRVRWSAKHRKHLFDVAIELAGLHQQAFLEFCLFAVALRP